MKYLKKILVIEDDPFVTEIYKTKLEQEDFFVDVATDGEMALDKLKEEKYDLILLDIVLPKINGWKILERIKTDSSLKLNTKDLKIIILSNLGQEEEVKKGIELGATKYLIKVYYTPLEVVEEIKKMLENNF